jgi:hypothetical protein
MRDNNDTSLKNGLSAPDASGTFARPKESDLDRDRTASMADEGGMAAAVADLRDQLTYVERELLPQVVPPAAAWSFARVRWSTLVWSAVALGAAGVFAGLALRYRGGRA